MLKRKKYWDYKEIVPKAKKIIQEHRVERNNQGHNFVGYNVLYLPENMIISLLSNVFDNLMKKNPEHKKRLVNVDIAKYLFIKEKLHATVTLKIPQFWTLPDYWCYIVLNDKDNYNYLHIDVTNNITDYNARNTHYLYDLLHNHTEKLIKLNKHEMV